ncbi:hypothetical protein C1E23_06700, partial [Pseudoalteromonas phenolica]
KFNVPLHTEIESLKMLGQLKRELTSLKRTYSSGGKRAYGEEQGILSYMNSLCASMKSLNFIDEDIYKRERVYLSSLSQSFAVQTDKRDRRDKVKLDISSQYRVYVTWGFSFISLAWLIVFKGYLINDSKHKVGLSISLSEGLITFLLTILCASIIYTWLVKRKIKITINDKGFKTWIETIYDIEDKAYKSYLSKKIGMLVLTITLPILLILGLHYLVS